MTVNPFPSPQSTHTHTCSALDGMFCVCVRVCVCVVCVVCAIIWEYMYKYTSTGNHAKIHALPCLYTPWCIDLRLCTSPRVIFEELPQYLCLFSPGSKKKLQIPRQQNCSLKYTATFIHSFSLFLTNSIFESSFICHLIVAA